MVIKKRKSKSSFSCFAGFYKWTSLCLCASMLAGCAAPITTITSTTTDEQSLPSTTVYFYPSADQSQEEQERDRYECYLWAVDQSGFDPAQEQLAPHQRITVVPTTPPGTDVAVGAATGAVIGSILAGPHSGPEGLVFGVITGMIFGAASEVGKQNQRDQIQEQYDDADKIRYNRLEKQANSYRRAMSACLEGRDYTVQ
ncbi:MAG: succinate dehydrogenase/fumarate reductase flavoprotein subunit [Desulforhopalus sp.]|jgi:succinate dehydrogenase/fumarate reductase flavoprotein subunit